MRRFGRQWAQSLTLVWVTAVASVAAAQALRLVPFIDQRVALFASPWVTTGGLGGGIGIEAAWQRYYSAELQVARLWGMGNVALVQGAFGVSRDGFYQPGARLVLSALMGDRIELLFDDGRRPARPSWAIGPRLLPLRFGTDRGFVSVCEAGIGTDFNGGLMLELVVLKAGAQF